MLFMSVITSVVTGVILALKPFMLVRDKTDSLTDSLLFNLII